MNFFPTLPIYRVCNSIKITTVVNKNIRRQIIPKYTLSSFITIFLFHEYSRSLFHSFHYYYFLAERYCAPHQEMFLYDFTISHQAHISESCDSIVCDAQILCFIKLCSCRLYVKKTVSTLKIPQSYHSVKTYIVKHVQR